MNKYIIYSILQYKHNLSLGEILNVGILFYFPEEKQFEFSHGDATRLKAVYPDFNSSLFSAYIRNIKDNIKNAIDLFAGYPLNNDFTDFIHKKILAVDAAGLVFSEPNQAINVFKDRETTVSEFAKLFLPGIDVEGPTRIRHNEEYLVRKFKRYFENDKIEKHLTKDEIIKTKFFTHKFEYSWSDKITKNFIKPVSFDLLEEYSIQSKAALHFGYLNDLNEYSKSKNFRFDLLIAKPQDKSLTNAYQNALDYIDSAKGPKKLVFENKIGEYTDEILSELNFN